MSTPGATLPSHDNRREPADRRRRPTHPFWPLFAPRRRAGFRRDGEAARQYVDRLQPRIGLWAIVVMTACVADALLTLIHLERGGEEWMPTMRWALALSQEAFLGIKLVLTAAGAIFLAVHQNFFAARFCIRFVFFVYFFLMIYHLVVISLRV